MDNTEKDMTQQIDRFIPKYQAYIKSAINIVIIINRSSSTAHELTLNSLYYYVFYSSNFNVSQFTDNIVLL